MRISLEYFASDPPFNNKPLPEQIESAAICGKQSGRDSKITRSTPMGVVICFSVRPSARRVRRRTRPERDRNRWHAIWMGIRTYRVHRLFRRFVVDQRREFEVSSPIDPIDRVRKILILWKSRDIRLHLKWNRRRTFFHCFFHIAFICLKNILGIVY